AGDDCLVVTTAKEIRVYLSAARQLGQRRTEVMLHPKSAGAHYQLAVAATEAGLEADALEHFRQAEQLANPDERWQGTLLKERARAERHQLLLEQAARCRRRTEWEEAASLLTRAAATEFSLSQRLQALAEQAKLWSAAGQPNRALAVWQSILDDAQLRQGR